MPILPRAEGPRRTPGSTHRRNRYAHVREAGEDAGKLLAERNHDFRLRAARYASAVAPIVDERRSIRRDGVYSVHRRRCSSRRRAGRQVLAASQNAQSRRLCALVAGTEAIKSKAHKNKKGQEKSLPFSLQSWSDRRTMHEFSLYRSNA